jgi:hypothetical protein
MRKYFDFAGMFVSILCIVHCIALPFVLFMIPTSLTLLQTNPENELMIHQVFLALAVLSAVFPFMRGYNIHKRFVPVLLCTTGIFLFAFSAFWAHDLLGHEYEKLVAILGSVFLIGGHYLNHKFCNHCDSHEHSHGFNHKKIVE